MRTYIPGDICMFALCPHNISRGIYICLFQGGRTHMESVTARNRSEEGLWSTGRSGWRKPQGNAALATPGHCLAYWPVTLTACVRGTLEKYIPRDIVRGDIYLSRDICSHYILLRFSAPIVTYIVEHAPIKNFYFVYNVFFRCNGSNLYLSYTSS